MFRAWGNHSGARLLDDFGAAGWYLSGMKILFALISLLFAASLLAGPGPFSGTATVIDGDTIDIHGQRVRLHGIDSPEGAQRCYRERKEWRCGKDAANALSDFIGGAPVTCFPRDIDRYQRVVAVCSVRGESINHWMVRQGWAVAYRRYSRDYDGAELDARHSRRGIWASQFEMPWDWRKSRRSQ